MPTSTRSRLAPRSRKAAPRRRARNTGDPRKVLIAVDGSAASNAAVRFARRMAELNLWAPDAITVAQPLPTYVGDILMPAQPLAQDVVQNNVLLAIRAQLRRHGMPTWPANVRFGPTGWSIVESAHELGAQLIVVGLGRHGKVARLFGAETANRVARKSDLPVLAVHARARGLPRVIVVAVDFGEASNRAVHEALELLESGGELHLVHVMSSYNFTPVADGAWRLSYAEAVERSFGRLRGSLAAAVAIRTRLLTGDLVECVTKYARSVRAGLIALGSHNQGFVERVLLGSAPSALLRVAPCSVLVAPPPPGNSTAGA